jgi:hypothetical protein
MSCLLTLTVSCFLFVFAPFVCANSTDWIHYPDTGTATMTHYSLPQNYVASCGCTGESTHFPTAALNQMAFGSSNNYGPSCGRCFKLTLLNTFLSHPPFYPTVTKSVVVKVTDLCPLSTTGWCNATTKGPNSSVIPCRRCTCAYGETTVLEAISTLILRFHRHQYPAISSLPMHLSMVSDIRNAGRISSSKRTQRRLYRMSSTRRNDVSLKWSAFAGFWSVEYQLPERFLCV